MAKILFVSRKSHHPIETLLLCSVRLTQFFLQIYSRAYMSLDTRNTLLKITKGNLAVISLLSVLF